MKKRIGTKLYDTNASEMIAAVGVGILYRKRTRKREWFLLIDDKIEPLEENEAIELLGKNTIIEKKIDSDFTTIRVDRITHKKLEQKAEEKGLSIAKYMQKLFDTL